MIRVLEPHYPMGNDAAPSERARPPLYLAPPTAHVCIYRRMESLCADLPNLRVERAELCADGRLNQHDESGHPDDIRYAGGAFRVTHVSFHAAQGATLATALRQDG